MKAEEKVGLSVQESKSLHCVQKKKILVQQDFILVRYAILNVITSHVLEAADSVAMATSEAGRKSRERQRR